MFTKAKLLLCLAFSVVLVGFGDKYNNAALNCRSSARPDENIICKQIRGVQYIMSGYKMSVTEYYHTTDNNKLPATNADAGIISTSNEYLASVNVTDGTIVATLQTTNLAAGLAGKTITATPVIIFPDKFIDWKCTTTADAKYQLCPES